MSKRQLCKVQMSALPQIKCLLIFSSRQFTVSYLHLKGQALSLNTSLNFPTSVIACLLQHILGVSQAEAKKFIQGRVSTKFLHSTLIIDESASPKSCPCFTLPIGGAPNPLFTDRLLIYIDLGDTQGSFKKFYKGRDTIQ